MLEMFLKCAEEGVLRPIEPLTVFAATDIEQAFKFLEDPGHIGKVVVNMAPSTSLIVSPSPQHLALDPEGTYILTGGVGGLGRAVATWMVGHGARHLTFLSRTSGTSDTSKELFNELEAMGCSVTAVAGRAESRQDVETAVRESKRPVKGVLHLAMVLEASVLFFSSSFLFLLFLFRFYFFHSFFVFSLFYFFFIFLFFSILFLFFSFSFFLSLFLSNLLVKMTEFG